MTSFTIHCRCGEPFHVTDAAVGRRISCRRCGQTVEVAEPTPAEPRRRFRRGKRRSRAQQKRTTTPASRQSILIRPSRSARVIALLVRAYLAGVVGVAAFMWLWGDRTVLGTVLLFMGRWVFLLPLALLLPAVLWLRRDLLLPLAAAALVALGPVMGLRVGWRRLLPAPDGDPVRVVTYNVGALPYLAGMLPTLLFEWRAEVVALQECSRQIAFVMRQLPGWHVYSGPDLCLLSRFPILEQAVMDRSALDRVKQSEDDRIGGAGYVVRFVLDGPRGPIRVANLHLETPRKGLEGLMSLDFPRLRTNTEIRDLENRLARQWVDSGTGPLLVLGDFNTPVESRIFSRYWGDLTDAFSAAGTGFGMSKYNGWIRVRIDHVLANDAWHVDRVRTGPEGYSDHRPVIVDLTLKR